MLSHRFITILRLFTSIITLLTAFQHCYSNHLSCKTRKGGNSRCIVTWGRPFHQSFLALISNPIMHHSTKFLQNRTTRLNLTILNIWHHQFHYTPCDHCSQSAQSIATYAAAIWLQFSYYPEILPPEGRANAKISWFLIWHWLKSWILPEVDLNHSVVPTDQQCTTILNLCKIGQYAAEL